MSYRGVVEANCPAGCDQFEAEVWSVIRGDKDPELKERLLAGEINMLACPTCEKVFYYEQPLVYMDPGREMMAFIYPTEYAVEEQKWRDRMAADFEQFQEGLKERKLYKPSIYFGIYSFMELMHNQEDIWEEAEVATFVMKEAGLQPFLVSPAYARELKLPPILPLGHGKDFKEKLTDGLRRLNKANDALVRYGGLLTALEEDTTDWEDPPGIAVKIKP